MIKKRENADCADSKAFTEYSNYMDDIYKNIENYNPNKKPETLRLLICLVIKNLVQ